MNFHLPCCHLTVTTSLERCHSRTAVNCLWCVSLILWKKEEKKGLSSNNRKMLICYFVPWLILTVPPWCTFVWQMRARRCAVHLLILRAVDWGRWASSYGRYVIKHSAPGTTFSLLSSALSSSLLAPCRPGWWVSSWCSMSATSRRKTSSSRWTTRKKALRQAVLRAPGVAMTMGI